MPRGHEYDPWYSLSIRNGLLLYIFLGKRPSLLHPNDLFPITILLKGSVLSFVSLLSL